MAVAFDAFSNVAAATGNLSWTHTPVGTPRAVIVMCIGTSLGADEFVSVTYGGVSMTEIANSPNFLEVGEGGCVSVYFLGSGILTGARTVSVTVNGTGSKRAAAITLTAASDTEIVTSSLTSAINNTSIANPSTVLNLNGRTCFCGIVFYSGQDAVNSITPLTNWTSRLEHDFGTDTGGWYTYNIIGSSNVTAGWTQTAEDALAIAFAVSEVASAGGSIRLLTLTGCGT